MVRVTNCLGKIDKTKPPTTKHAYYKGERLWMGKSIAGDYMQFIDTGLSFSTDEVEQWEPMDFVTARLPGLCHQHLVLVWQRVMVPVNVDRKEWWSDAERILRGCINSYCTAVLGSGPPAPELTGGMEEDQYGERVHVLPSKASREGKALMAEALKLDANSWIGSWSVDAEDRRRYVASLSQAALTVPRTKGYVSRCNKTIRVLSNEVDGARKLDDLMIAFDTKSV